MGDSDGYKGRHGSGGRPPPWYTVQDHPRYSPFLHTVDYGFVISQSHTRRSRREVDWISRPLTQVPSLVSLMTQ